MYGNIANNWKNEEWRGLRRNKVQGRWGHICLSLLGVLWQKTMGCGLSKRHWVLILLEAGSPGAGCQHHQGPGEGLLLPCSWLPSWSIPTWQGEAAGLSFVPLFPFPPLCHLSPAAEVTSDLIWWCLLTFIYSKYPVLEPQALLLIWKWKFWNL